MTSSDIIAIIAIIISGVTSVATLIASFYTNRANIAAKRQEIEDNIIAKRREVVFNERLRAFSETLEELNGLKISMLKIINILGCSDDHRKNMISGEFQVAFQSFSSSYGKKRVFFPRNINDIIIEYINSLGFSDNQDAVIKIYERTIKTETTVINMIRDLNSFK